MKLLSRISMSVIVLLVCVSAVAQQKIDPKRQINWPIGCQVYNVATGTCPPVSTAALVPRGAWNSGTAYAVNDIVSYSGNSYAAIQAGTNQQPDTATTFWTLFVTGGGVITSVTFTGTGSPTLISGVLNIPPVSVGNVGLCALADGVTNLCVTSSPFNASPYGATTTVTTGTNAPGTTIAVSSSATFSAGYDVSIAGAGASSGLYIGTISGVPDGLHIVLSTSTSTSVASGAVVKHDETRAILAAQAALQATGVGGWLLLPCPIASSMYRVNGPLLDTSEANAILPMPKLPNYTNPLIYVGYRGCGVNGQTILQTDQTTGNFIGGYNSATGGGYNPFTSAAASFKDLTIQIPGNTNMTAVNLTAVETAPRIENLIIRGGNASPPTGGTSWGLRMPAILNVPYMSGDQLIIAGFTNGLVGTEHNTFGKIVLEGNINCLVLDNGGNIGAASSITSIGYTGHSFTADDIWFNDCTNNIVGSSTHSAVNIGVADMELTTGNGILDASNSLYGIIGAQITDSRGSTTPCNANVNGAAHLTIHYINCQPEAGGGGSGIPLSTNLVEEWAAHEGSGTTESNSGSDSSNTLTLSSVTWASASGFSGNQPTYTGTSSSATASSYAFTNFDGSTGFSTCVWLNPSDLSGTVDNIISDANSTTGYLVNVLGAGIGGFQGAIQVYMYSDLTHYISVHTPAAAVVVGTAANVCMYYDGTKLASGVHVSVNGISQTMTTQSDTISGGSIASSHVLGIGTTFPGTIGKLEIWNRTLSGADTVTLHSGGTTSIE